MRHAVKKALPVTACQLGAGSTLEENLLAKGLLIREGDTYRVFSREAMGSLGQQVFRGDFVKLDLEGFPYPNSREGFLQNHDQTGPESYIQKERQVLVWFMEDPMEPEVDWLMCHKGLEIGQAGFRATLWGTELTAPRDAALVFYSITRDEAGQITDAEFNFVVREEFEKTYYFQEK